ncbi:MAG TPA: porin [Geminicoccaceae bacterium]|nr:porin [Geminicoccus sp.]HMU48988.1 porin [Geminicoccaceae bacterium]
MRCRNLVLSSTAAIGLLAASAAAQAATVAPGGALDLTLTGFARFLAHGGDLDNARLDRTIGGGLDFSNDTEVHLLARSVHEASGIEYGGTVEFESDTNETLNTDETWVFVRGGFGEFRFGDLDGVIENSVVAAQTIAAGTGGIDGTIVDAIGTTVIHQFDTGDSTKIRYYTPSFGGFSVGASYTPQVDSDGQDLARKATVDPTTGRLGPSDRPINDVVEGALVYEGEFGGFSLLGSLIGSICDYSPDGGGDDDCHTWGGGLSTELFGFKLAGSYWTEKLGDAEKTGVTAGIGYGIGPVNTSVTWGKIIDSDNLESDTGVPLDQPQNLVASADLGLMPGLVLGGDIGWFDNDADGGLPGSLEDDGYQAVMRLDLAF